MTFDTPSIDIILGAFFDTKLARAKAERRQRLRDADARLRLYLENVMPSRMCSECNAVIFAERQFTATDVVARLFGADMLIKALPGYLSPGLLSADATERRMQYEVVRGLGRMLINDDLIEVDDYWSFEASIARLTRSRPYRGHWR